MSADDELNDSLSLDEDELALLEGDDPDIDLDDPDAAAAAAAFDAAMAAAAEDLSSSEGDDDVAVVVDDSPVDDVSDEDADEEPVYSAPEAAPTPSEAPSSALEPNDAAGDFDQAQRIRSLQAEVRQLKAELRDESDARRKAEQGLRQHQVQASKAAAHAASTDIEGALAAAQTTLQAQYEREFQSKLKLELDRQKRELGRELQSLKDQLYEAEQAAEKAGEGREKRNREVARIQSELENALADKKDAEADARRYEKALKDLQRKTDSESGDRLGAERQLRTLRVDYDNLMAKYKEQGTQMSAQVQQQKEKDEALSKATLQLEEEKRASMRYARDADRISTQIEALKDQITELEDERTELQADAAQYKLRVAELETASKVATGTIDRLEMSRAAVDKDLALLQSQLDDERSRNSTRLSTIQRKLEGQIKDLNRQLDEALSAKQEQSRAVRQLKRDLKHAKFAAEQAEREARRVGYSAVRGSVDSDSLSERLRVAELRATDAEERNKTMERRLSNLTGMKEDERREKERLQRIVDRLQEEVEDLRDAAGAPSAPAAVRRPAPATYSSSEEDDDAAVVDDAVIDDAIVDDAIVDDAVVDDAIVDDAVVDDAVVDDAVADDLSSEGDDGGVVDDAVIDDAVIDDAVIDDAVDAE